MPRKGRPLAAAVVERNQAAARVMQELGIPTDDLYTCILPHVAQMQNPKDVHFNAAGYERLGKQVAASITAALK